MANKLQVLSLYKSLLRESQKFYSYNFRNYAARKVKDSFQSNKALTDPKLIKKEYESGQEHLGILIRQAKMSNWYRSDKLIIEKLYNRLSA